MLLSRCVAGVSADLKTVIVQRAASFPMHKFLKRYDTCQQILHPTGILPSGKLRWSDKNMLHQTENIFVFRKLGKKTF